MQDWLDRFMVGKKKYSASVILPIIIAVINTFVADPKAAESLTSLVQEFAPTLIALFGGITYTIIEGMRDKELAKQMPTAIAPSPPSIVLPPVMVSGVSQSPPSIVAPSEPFNPTEFSNDLDDRARRTYLEVNAITRFFAARDKGLQTPCADIQQAVDYTGYLLDLAHKAFEEKFGFSFMESDQHLADDKTCPYYSLDNMARQKGIDFWNMLLQLRKVMVDYASVCRLQDSGLDFKASLPQNYQTLYYVMTLSAEMLETAQRR